MIELISKAVPMLTDGMRIIHCIFCTEKNCRHNIEAICTHKLPEIFGNPNFSMANEFICRSFEEEPKEEPKMSDVKITYKPVDKKDALRHLLACEDDFHGGCIAAEDMIRKIDSIYNAKEEDGEIGVISFDFGSAKLVIAPNPFQDDIDIAINTVAPARASYHLLLKKQELKNIGQALIKMSEQ